MEKFTALCKLGIKYLYRYKKRYAFLLAALVFGFGIVTLMTSLKDGMYSNVYYSAQSHYAGDIIAVGYDSDTGILHMEYNEISTIINISDSINFKPDHTVLRTLFGEYGVIYFNGNAVRLKYVVGCDWETEGHLFSKMDFVTQPEKPFGGSTIILSEPVARQLGAVTGDSIILEVDTRWGQKNTGIFIVEGIVYDSSIFGYYKVYISRLILNRLLLFNDTDCSTVGFFFGSISNIEQKRLCLQNALADNIQTGSLVYNREELSRETGQWVPGIRIFLFTLPVYLSEISDLLDAMNILTYFLYGMMLIIILVSAAVTYRLIIHERAHEMGIMRSIGFYGGDLRLVLWIEILSLGIVSLVLGFLLALLLNRVMSFMSFSWFPSFEIFQKDGKLSVLYLPETVFANVALVFFVLFCAAFFPSLGASKKKLPVLLSGEVL
ncbi:MAG: FtsX-like permease family protein [Treponema sp.]|jgi:ABC-type lipoprotein release transport system permease subunit|nr:FtsX-like permease family protein [Treponema sp.]